MPSMFKGINELLLQNDHSCAISKQISHMLTWAFPSANAIGLLLPALALEFAIKSMRLVLPTASVCFQTAAGFLKCALALWWSTSLAASALHMSLKALKSMWETHLMVSFCWLASVLHLGG